MLVAKRCTLVWTEASQSVVRHQRLHIYHPCSSLKCNQKHSMPWIVWSIIRLRENGGRVGRSVREREYCFFLSSNQRTNSVHFPILSKVHKDMDIFLSIVLTVLCVFSPSCLSAFLLYLSTVSLFLLLGSFSSAWFSFFLSPALSLPRSPSSSIGP